MSREGHPKLTHGLTLTFWKQLALGLALATLLLSRWQPIYWEDVWIYLGIGRYMLSHHVFLRSDIFAWPVLGARWVNTDWLYEVILTVVVNGVGLFGVTLLKNSLVLVSLFFVDKRLRLWGASTAERIMFVGLVFLAGWPFWVERADLSSLAFFSALFSQIDHEFLSTWKTSRWLTWIILFVFWANTHGEFTFGLVVLAAYGGMLTITGQPSSRAALAGLLCCTMATFLNPYGPGLHLGILRFMKNPIGDIYEWMPPHGAGFLFFDFAFILLGVSIVARRSTTPQAMFAALLSVVFGVFALRHQRFIHFFMVGVFPYAGFNWLQSRPREWMVKSLRTYENWLLGFLSILLFWSSLASAQSISGGIDVHSSGYIKGVCDFIDRYEVRGPFYNEYKFGAYWLYRFQGHPAEFQDGRDAVVDRFHNIIAQSAEAHRTPAAWDEFMHRYGFEAVIVASPPVPVDKQVLVLNRYFLPSQWVLAYRDDLCVLFLKRHSINESVIKQVEARKLI
jgi:hypothetical protein